MVLRRFLVHIHISSRADDIYIIHTQHTHVYKHISYKSIMLLILTVTLDGTLTHNFNVSSFFKIDIIPF